MTAVAKGRYLRISPLKVRKIIKLVRGKNVVEAQYILKTLPNKAAAMTYKVIAAAVANFKQKNPDGEVAKLVVQTIFADQAPVLRRLMPRARGRADVLRKQSSHLSVIVGDSINE